MPHFLSKKLHKWFYNFPLMIELLIKLLFQSQYLSLTLDFQFFLSISLMKAWSFMMKSKTQIFLNIYDWMFENIFTHFVGLHLEIQNDIFADFGRVFFSDISDWLLKEIILTFFISLHNQSRSIRSFYTFHFPKIHWSVFRKITIIKITNKNNKDLLYFWDVYGNASFPYKTVIGSSKKWY